ncbi:hypothetical protein PROFUN_13478 [Planoprotostelium fungivorum]|uniref:Uncharacterized protein n=1 Tax=Planoprotostelium fungivorum TaxID=1890364 RepID=A0A2P6N3V6_9EUKA|nr:hypothetical protein PROFUN_13478 [Planoprotostelium fungivorum]
MLQLSHKSDRRIPVPVFYRRRPKEDEKENHPNGSSLIHPATASIFPKTCDNHGSIQRKNQATREKEEGCKDYFSDNMCRDSKRTDDTQIDKGNGGDTKRNSTEESLVTRIMPLLVPPATQGRIMRNITVRTWEHANRYLKRLPIINIDEAATGEPTLIGGVYYRAFERHQAEEHYEMMRIIWGGRPDIKRSLVNHRSLGGMRAALGWRRNTRMGLGTYAFQRKVTEQDRERMLDMSRRMTKRVVSKARRHLPELTSDLEGFHKEHNMEAAASTFITEEYQACGHIDKDRTTFSIGLCGQRDETLRGGWFYIASYGVSIQLNDNTMWFFRGRDVHGTSLIRNLDTRYPRYSVVVVLPEKTARAFEAQTKQFESLQKAIEVEPVFEGFTEEEAGARMLHEIQRWKVGAKQKKAKKMKPNDVDDEKMALASFSSITQRQRA